jgi:hypothetical protein
MPLKTTAGTHGEVIKGRGSPSTSKGASKSGSASLRMMDGSRIHLKSRCA